MPRDRYSQPTGLLIPPEGTDKTFISWTLDNVLEGFKYYFKQHNKWPDHLDLNTCAYLPSVKTLERKFGGMKGIRSELGLNDIDHGKGTARSKIATSIGKRGFNLEEEVYSILVNKFYEPFVHYEARITKSTESGKSLNVDFLVYHNKGKFAVDVFWPDSALRRFEANAYMKFKTYWKFPYKLFLVVGNPTITKSMMDIFIHNTKYQNNNLALLSMNDFIKQVGEYQALLNPYN
jgi:hypothetical protein